MFINYKGFKINITEELQETLRMNPSRETKLPIIISKRDSKSGKIEQVQDTDRFGEPLFKSAINHTHDKVHFDLSGRHYFNVFPSIKMEVNKIPTDILVTNPKVKIENPIYYGAGELSHHAEIPGSELWDTGKDAVVREPVCKGKIDTKIVLTLSAEEVLKIDLKPQDASLVSQIARASDEEKAVMAREMFGDKAYEAMIAATQKEE